MRTSRNLVSLGEYLLTLDAETKLDYLATLYETALKIVAGGSPQPVWRIAATIGLMQWKGYLRLEPDDVEGGFMITDMDVARNERELTLH